MPPFAPGRTQLVIAAEAGVVARIDPEKPVLRILATEWCYVTVGVNLTLEDLDAASERDEENYAVGLPIPAMEPTLVLKGHGANTIIVVGRTGSQVFVTAGEIR